MAPETAYYPARTRPAGFYRRLDDKLVLQQIRAITNSRAPITGVIPGTTSEYGRKYGGSTGDASDPARGISWHFATKMHRA